MLKKSLAIIALITLISGCTREVYLQAVPCETDCGCPTVVEPVCPEMVTRTVKYQVYEAVPVVQKTAPCHKQTTTKTCTTTCRQVQTN